MNTPDTTQIVTSAPVVEPISVPEAGPSELDTVASGFIKQMEAKFQAENLNTQLEAVAPKPDAPVEEAKPEEPAPVQPEVKAEPTAQSTAEIIAKALEESRRLAREEKEARKAAKAREKELAERNAPPQDEIEALKRMGYDPDLLVKKILAQKLGDKAPPELVKGIRETEQEYRIRTLENKVVAQSRELAAREYFDQVARGANEFIGKGEYSKDAPTVAEIAKRDPARVHAEVMNEIVADARLRAAQDPNGDVMSYAQAVARVEKRWSEYRKLFSAENQPANTQTPAPQQEMEKKSAPKAIKPPDRPLAPWLKGRATEDDGLRAGIEEFMKAEGLKPR